MIFGALEVDKGFGSKIQQGELLKMCILDIDYSDFWQLVGPVGKVRGLVRNTLELF